MLRRLLHRRPDDRGATLVLVALGLVVLVGFVGFAVDLGRVYNERRQEQSAVDAGALAAARNAFLLNSTDDVIFDVVVDQTLANMDFPVARTEWVTAWQGCTDPGRVAAGYTTVLSTSSGDIDCISFTSDGLQMRVLLPDTEVDTLFAQLLGADGWDVNALAEVQMLDFNSGNNLIPFGLSTASTQYGSYQCIKVPPNGQSSVCNGSTQGNFNYLDIKRPTVGAAWSCNGAKDQRLVENTAAGIDHYLGTRSGTSDNTEDGGLGTAVLETCPNVLTSLADVTNTSLYPNKIDTETGTIGSNCGNPSSGGLVEGLVSPNVRTDGKGGRLTRVPSTDTYPWATWWRTRSWTCFTNTYTNLDDTPLWWFMAPSTSATSFVDGSALGSATTVSYTGTAPWTAVQTAFGVTFPLGSTVESVLNGLADPVAAANAIVANAPATANASQIAPYTCDPDYIENTAPTLGITRTQGMANCFNDYSASREAYRLLNGGATDIENCAYCYTVKLFTRDSDGDGLFDLEYSPRFTWIPEMHQNMDVYLAGGSKPLSIKRFRAMFVSTLFIGKNNGSLAGSWSVGDTPTNTSNILNGFAGFVFDYEMLPPEIIDRQQQFPDSEPGFQLIR